MRFLFSLILLSFPFFTRAHGHLATQIHDIDFGEEKDEYVLVLLKNGHVTKIPKWDATLLQELSSAKEDKSFLNIDVDKERYILDVDKVEKPLPPPEVTENSSEKEDYIPTVIPSMSEARKIFKAARYYSKESQCFNRAHVWSFEWWKKFNLNSNKILIYFSRTYIRRYNFEWWFHIAPFVLINDNGQIVERAMDVKYTSGPLKFRTWSKIFLRDDAVCPVITKYSEYADYPYVGSCFFQRTNMYTYQPADLQMLEAFNYKKTAWLPKEVNGAYLEAFDEHVDVTEDLAGVQ